MKKNGKKGEDEQKTAYVYISCSTLLVQSQNNKPNPLSICTRYLKFSSFKYLQFDELDFYSMVGFIYTF